MSGDREFFERVQEAAEGTPYVVTETADGFDVALHIVDAQWFGLFNKAGLQRLYIHHVKLAGDGAFWAFDEHGRFGVQADYRFNSEEGRHLIEGVATQLGLEQRRGREEKIALFFGLFALGGIAIGGIVVGVLALLGAF
jgi:hypothetical protein